MATEEVTSVRSAKPRLGELEYQFQRQTELVNATLKSSKHDSSCDKDNLKHQYKNIKDAFAAYEAIYELYKESLKSDGAIRSCVT